LNADFPFCSERCRDRDLGNWATEKYVVSDPIFNEDEDESPDNGSVNPTRKTIILDLDEQDLE
jgi:endogenous inhibitor of DNA gyrase (YacG/DUF329 family)